MAAKTVDLLTDRFLAHSHTSLRKHLFIVSGAARKAIRDPDGTGDAVARKTKARQARDFGRYLQA